MKSFSTLTMITVALAAAQKGSATLANPYGERPYDIDTIQPAVSSEECDYVDTVKTTKRNPAGKIVEETTEFHCLRALDVEMVNVEMVRSILTA